MDIRKALLFGGLAFILVTLFSNWQTFTAEKEQQILASEAAAPVLDTGVPQTPTSTAPASASNASVNNDLPNATDEVASESNGGNIVTVNTDVYVIKIDTLGGTLVDVQLKNYPVNIKTPDISYELMQDNPPLVYSAQTGLIGTDNENLPNHNTLFTSAVSEASLKDGEESVSVDFTWSAPNGSNYKKTYTFHRNSYRFDINFDMENNSAEPIDAFLYSQFKRTDTPVEQFGLFGQSPSFTGGAYYTHDSKYDKISFGNFDDPEDGLKNRPTNNGWVAIIEHYFVSAWFPEQVTENVKDEEMPAVGTAAYELYTRTVDQGRFFQIGYKTAQPTIIEPGQTKSLKTSAFVGPKDQEHLKAQGIEGLLLTVDYGFLTAIATPLFWVLSKIYQFVQNWGFSIIILTVMIKLCFFPLSAASYKSMAKMRKFQPRVQTLRERYKDDRQKMNQEMMKLYKEEKVNPMGGCLPIVIQIPVFIALYWVLLESVELRQAPFIGWIQDLSQKDPFYVLPVLYGISMFVTQRLNPQPVDPIQQKVMMFMPVMFSVLFLFFPAGLVLYWLVNNLLTIAQQSYINKKYA